MAVAGGEWTWWEQPGSGFPLRGSPAVCPGNGFISVSNTEVCLLDTLLAALTENSPLLSSVTLMMLPSGDRHLRGKELTEARQPPKGPSVGTGSKPLSPCLPDQSRAPDPLESSATGQRGEVAHLGFTRCQFCANQA